jgi:hypothetical protein
MSRAGIYLHVNGSSREGVQRVWPFAYKKPMAYAPLSHAAGQLRAVKISTWSSFWFTFLAQQNGYSSSSWPFSGDRWPLRFGGFSMGLVSFGCHANATLQTGLSESILNHAALLGLVDQF